MHEAAAAPCSDGGMSWRPHRSPSLGCSVPDGSLKSARARGRIRHGGNPSTFARFSHARPARARRARRPHTRPGSSSSATPGLSAAERADIRADAGCSPGRDAPLPRTEVVTAPAGDAPSGAARAQRRPRRRVRRARPRPPRMADATTRSSPSLWGLENTGQYVTASAHGRRCRPTPTWTSPRPGTIEHRRGRDRRGGRHRVSTPTPGPRRADRMAVGADFVGSDRTRPTRTATARTSRARSRASATTRRASPASRPTPRSCRSRRSTRTAPASCPTSRSRPFNYAGDHGVRDRQRRASAAPTPRQADDDAIAAPSGDAVRRSPPATTRLDPTTRRRARRTPAPRRPDERALRRRVTAPTTSRPTSRTTARDRSTCSRPATASTRRSSAAATATNRHVDGRAARGGGARFCSAAFRRSAGARSRLRRRHASPGNPALWTNP